MSFYTTAARQYAKAVVTGKWVREVAIDKFGAGASRQVRLVGENKPPGDVTNAATSV